MLNLSGYQILTHLYESANSIVYRGIRAADNQAVIIKVLKQEYPTPAELARYQQEYDITHHLNLDSVVKAYSLEPYQNTLVIIFEDFGGLSLKMLMDERTFTLSEFLQIAIQIVDSLGNIHAAHIIHKDINPSNIVFNPETGQLKIIDFGIATRLTRSNPTLKNPHVLEGTLVYISPEQTGRMNRTLDYRTDFYSLGVTFYELLTNKLPFETPDAMELVHCHLAKQPLPPSQINPEIPQPVSDIVMKLLAKNAEERYQSAWGIQADLVMCLMQLEANGVIADLIPGENDISDKFQISQKLYGREREIEMLLAALERVAAGRKSEVLSMKDEMGAGLNPEHPTNRPLHTSELMLISGHSGIGKSTLVKEIYKSITEKRGYFITGKCDQFQRNIPYSAVVSAFAGLVRQLLTEREAQLQQLREKLLAALGSNTQVIIDVIPELELIVGKQPAVPELGATEAQNRFNRVFQQFIQVFCSDQHLRTSSLYAITQAPFVIFLDDLQWADSATLKLIELMMTNEDTQYLLVIGAYRDNEVNPTHPLMMMIEKLHQEGATVNQITLAPLKLNHVIHLIADTLHSDTSTVRPLAELVMQKTRGNPFFVNEFLKTLYEERLITFDFECLNWQWDVTEIEAKAITDNVVELMIKKMEKLPLTTQQILPLAACVGNTFDVQTLSIIRKKPKISVYDELMPALNGGLIVPTSEVNQKLLINEYKFLHDRVQQAAYALIDEPQKAEFHLQLGRFLLQNPKPAVLVDEIFKIVEHLNLGSELVSQQSERDEIAKLNLIAGHKAKIATAYESAVKYLNAGLELLAEDSWQTQYDLTLNLYVETVEAEYLNANFAQAKWLSDVVLQHAKTVLEKVKVYETQLRFYIAQNQLQAALDTGLQVLQMLGVSLSNSPPTDLIIEDLENLPQMTEPDKLAAMRILTFVVISAHLGNPVIFPSIVFTMVSLCTDYGNSPLAALAYAYYGLLLCGRRGDIESGYLWGKLALRVVEQFETREIKYKVYDLFYAFISHRKELARESIEPWRESIQLCLETGEIEFACYSALNYCANIFLVGEPLDSVRHHQGQYIELIQKLKQEFQLYYTQIWGQLVLNLSGKAADKHRLIGEIFNEVEMLPLLQDANNLMSLFSLYLAKTLLSYLFKDYAGAVANAVLATNYEQAAAGLLPSGQNPFYYSLALLALYPNAKPGEQKEYLSQVKHNQKKMKIWANHAPMNYQHKYDLVEAQKARVLGQNWEAAQLYERAIKGARENGYLQEEALAYELAAEFYLARGMDKIAQSYMQEAHYGYVRWQATAKVEDLAARYPQFLKSSLAKSITDSHTITPITSTSTRSGEILDLAAVMKASQAISSEIVLDTLLTKMMKIIIENAGAEKGFFLVEKSGQWVVEVSGAIALDGVTVRLDIPLCDREPVLEKVPCLALPNTIINYVARTRENIVLGDAAQEGVFTQDNYIVARQPRSVLCTAIQHQGQLIGILYLENNLTTYAFTPERLSVLKLLCTQAAISLENARLYEQLENYSRTLEGKVEQRTQKLQQEIQERKLLAKKLHKSERKMRAVFAAMTDIVLIIDAEKNIEVVPTNTRALYASNPDIITHTIEQFLQNENAENWWRHIRRSLDTQQTLNVDYSLPIGDCEFWFTARISPMSTHSVIWVARDISDRKLAEEALRQSEEKFARAFRSSPCAITLTRRSDGCHIEVNDSFCQFTGYSREEIIGRTAVELNLWVNLEARNYMFQALTELRTIHNYEFDFRTKSGAIRTALLSTEIINFYGQTCLISVSQDISDRKLAEAALQKAKEEAEAAKKAADAANRAKSEFLANMSHELRTPLNAILGFSQLMYRTANLKPEQKENLRIITRSGEHLLTLINQVLDLAKIEAGRITLNEHNFDLYRLLDDLEDMFRLRADDQYLQLLFERSPDVPQYVRTDEVKLRQVLINLLNNAIKFTELGGVSVRVAQELKVRRLKVEGSEELKVEGSEELKVEGFKVEGSEELKVEGSKELKVEGFKVEGSEELEVEGSKELKVEGFKVEGSKELSNLQPSQEQPATQKQPVTLWFEVEDTGIGIAPEELDSLFQAFVQTRSGKASQEGTGLGLAIARKFVQLMGGEITVSSEVGRGSLFKFNIQVSMVDSSDIPTKQPTRRVIALELNQPRYRILIVDDRWENRQLLLKLLHPLGFELQEASNGMEALEVWERWQPHLIWMDMRMPVMDGYEATQRIKATTKGQATAVIALTASTLEEERAVILSSGCDDFVRKPFREAEILDTIHKHLGVRYIYDQPTDSLAKEVEHRNLLTTSTFATLPTELLTHLKQAAIRIDMDRIDNLIDEIRSLNAVLAERLATLASDFKYDEILTLIQQASEQGN